MGDAIEIEARGAAEGINPMFGEWQQAFDLEPVSYANQGTARAAHKESVRAQLRNRFVFVGEVSLTVVLYLDEQKMLETPSYGDIDNHAKQLLDTLKGSGGILIDDSQVQHLDISWIDVPYGARFEVAIKAGPDDFLPLPLRLYEMPDGLFYPISEQVWTKEGLLPAKADHVLLLAHALAEVTRQKRAFRHRLRQNGAPQFRAFQNGQIASPVLQGFHRSRVVDSGFELVALGAWSTPPAR